MFRVDPLNDNGEFDSDFCGTPGYGKFEKHVINYLKAEGFDEKTEEFVISLFGHTWRCSVSPFAR